MQCLSHKRHLSSGLRKETLCRVALAQETLDPLPFAQESPCPRRMSAHAPCLSFAPRIIFGARVVMCGCVVMCAQLVESAECSSLWRVSSAVCALCAHHLLHSVYCAHHLLHSCLVRCLHYCAHHLRCTPSTALVSLSAQRILRRRWGTRALPRTIRLPWHSYGMF